MATASSPSTDLPPKALLLDLAGVLYEGSALVPGAAEAVALAREHGLILRFVTNTATKSRSDILEKLQSLKIEVQPAELFTAPDATIAYLKARGLKPYPLVHPSIKAEFEALSNGVPDCVVLGDARDDLNYANLNRAFRLVHQGCPLLAIGDNKYFAEEEGLSLDAGPFVRAVAWAADAEPIIMGKPNRAFFEQVVASTGVDAAQCLMIGDDILGDVEGALNAGLQARLVKTGKYRDNDEHRICPEAQTLNSIADLEQIL